MSESHDQTASEESSSRPGGERYQSFTALRQAHIQLRLSWSESAATAADIRRFIVRARNTGALLETDNDRRGARGILDYWGSELVTATAEKLLPEDFTPAVLAPFDAEQAAGLPPPSSASNATTESTKRSREVIRLVAAARLWQDSGRKPGYLLYGDAIAEAARYRDVDPDIAELVNASEAKRDASRRKIKVVAAVAAAVVLGVIGMLLFETVGLYLLSDRYVASIKNPDTDSSTKTNRLWWLGRIQRWRPPFDFSGSSTILVDVSARNLRLHSPNFSSAKLDRVNVLGGEFSNAAFNDSRIFASNFRGARLPFAQFRAAQIASTSFAEADLYRATFDRVCLRDVDFSGADLRLTSFWGATFDRNQRNFRNTAWWLAEGWNADDLKDLLLQDQSKLSESAVFRRYLNAFTDSVKKAEAGTLQRVRDLNDMAWMLATWGIVGNLGIDPAGSTKQACTSATGVPDSALEAAEQAICIATSRNDPDLDNYKDTLAYVLMQTPGRMLDASNWYQKQALSEGSLFRAALAQFAVGDRNKAIADLKKSMEQRYLPTHELHTLKADIKDEFQTELLAYLNAVWPRPVAAQCQLASDTVNPPEAAHSPSEVKP
jgi:hypothetical protein